MKYFAKSLCLGIPILNYPTLGGLIGLANKNRYNLYLVHSALVHAPLYLNFKTYFIFTSNENIQLGAYSPYFLF